MKTLLVRPSFSPLGPGSAIVAMASTMAVLALALALGCSDKSKAVPTSAATGDVGQAASDIGNGSSAAETPASAAVKEKPPELAESPTIDLLANRYLLHLGSENELFVPFASEGLRKYDHDYSRPWGPIVSHAGERGRVLKKRATTIRVPWRRAGDAAGIHIRVAGLAAGQRLSVRVNGKIVGEKSLESGWQTVTLPAKGLKNGENDIGLFVRKAGRGGGAKSWALWQSLVVSGSDVNGETNKQPSEAVAELAVGSNAQPALTGFARQSFYVEIPAKSHLVFETGLVSGEAKFAVRATDASGAVTDLYSHDQSSEGWQNHHVRLDGLAGKLVALDLVTSSPKTSGFAKARIGLEKEPERARPEPMKNAILVVVDALRADKLKAYDPKTRVEAPRMNGETAKRGAVFLHSQAASPSSPPSHGSIQTGMIPRVHGVVGDNAEVFPSTPMLSTQARKAGIAAGYYGNNSFGMARLEKPGNWTAFHQPPREGKGNDCSTLFPYMLEFVKKQHDAGKRFVLSTLPYEPHTAYRYHEGISEKYHSGSWGAPVGKSVDGVLLSALNEGKQTLSDAQWSQLFALYDGEVTYFDSCFSNLLDELDKMGLTDDTAIILTSDHGEGMFEHKNMGHAWGHNAEVGNIPFVVMAKGFTDGGRIHDITASHVDIVPTILDLLGVEIDAKVQGRSMVPVMMRSGEWTPRVVSLEYGRSYSLRARQYRYIVDYQGKESLYDLGVDPTEKKNVMGASPIALRYLRDSTGVFLAHRSQWSVTKFGDLNNHSPAFAAKWKK